MNLKKRENTRKLDEFFLKRKMSPFKMLNIKLRNIPIFKLRCAMVKPLARVECSFTLLPPHPALGSTTKATPLANVHVTRSCMCIVCRHTLAKAATFVACPIHSNLPNTKCCRFLLLYFWGMYNPLKI